MSVCRCGHFESEHSLDGGLCRVRYGALGDSAFLELHTPYELCGCEQWAPEPKQPDVITRAEATLRSVAMTGNDIIGAFPLVRDLVDALKAARAGQETSS